MVDEVAEELLQHSVNTPVPNLTNTTGQRAKLAHPEELLHLPLLQALLQLLCLGGRESEVDAEGQQALFIRGARGVAGGGGPTRPCSRSGLMDDRGWADVKGLAADVRLGG